MKMARNKYKNMCTKDKWQVNSPKEQYFVALSSKLEKMIDTNIQFAKVFKTKGTLKGKNNKQISQKWNN